MIRRHDCRRQPPDFRHYDDLLSLPRHFHLFDILYLAATAIFADTPPQSAFSPDAAISCMLMPPLISSADAFDSLRFSSPLILRCLTFSLRHRAFAERHFAGFAFARCIFRLMMPPRQLSLPPLRLLRCRRFHEHFFSRRSPPLRLIFATPLSCISLILPTEPPISCRR